MTDEAIPNRRSKRRQTVETVVTIMDRMSGDAVGRLVNITTEGLMLVNTSPLSTDTLYQVSLMLPEPINGVNEIELGMDCLWTSPTTADADMYWSGCHIIDISDDMLVHLEQLVKDLDG